MIIIGYREFKLVLLYKLEWNSINKGFKILIDWCIF